MHILALKAVTKLSHNSTKLLVKGVCKANMANHTLLKESERTNALGTINNLVRHHEVPGLDLLLQTSHRRERNNGSHTQRAQSSNVGTGGNLVRCNLMVQSMAREESDGDVFAGGGRLVVQYADGR